MRATSRGLPVLMALGLCALPACQVGSSAPGVTPDVEHIPLGGDSRLPFSAAVRVGSMLYLSGQLGTDATGRLVPGGIAAETRQALENIRGVLERSGSSLDRVVKCTVMLADIAEWPEMNQVYVTYFTGRMPARSAFGATGLAFGARVEIECWATVAPPT